MMLRTVLLTTTKRPPGLTLIDPPGSPARLGFTETTSNAGSPVRHAGTWALSTPAHDGERGGPHRPRDKSGLGVHARATGQPRPGHSRGLSGSRPLISGPPEGR